MSNPGPNITQTSNLTQEKVPQSDGLQIGSTASALIGFYGATPAIQQGAALNVHTVAAGATTGVFVNTTFDGSLGTTAYTVGDIVAALKVAGLIAL